jgi:hypothetical protein
MCADVLVAVGKVAGVRPFVLEAEANVRVGVAQARQWFLDLEAHPERYVQNTHAGFAFTQGGFGQTGSRFVTWERFYGLKLALHFELGEVGGQRFRFVLRRPPLPIWGAFMIEALDREALDREALDREALDLEGREKDTVRASECVRLALRLGGMASVGEWFLTCPLVRKAVERQIGYEVEHIKASMEALYAPGRA